MEENRDDWFKENPSAGWIYPSNLLSDAEKALLDDLDKEDELCYNTKSKEETQC